MKRKNKNKPVIQINTSFVQPDCHGHEKLNDPTIQRINVFDPRMRATICLPRQKRFCMQIQVSYS